MTCKLCLEINENFLNILSEEGIRLNILAILHKHFPFCFEFQDVSDEGVICQKCWLKVEMFHEFYIYIESIHSSLPERESIFVSSITDHLMVSLKTNDDEPVECLANIKPETGIYESIGVSVTDNGEQKKFKAKSQQKRKTKPTIENKSSAKSRINVSKNQNQLSLQIKGERNGSSKIFKCDSCSLLFLSRYKMYAHIKNEHLALPFKCPTPRCNESFSTQHQLDEHLCKEHEQSECPRCGKKLLKHRVALHIQNYHNESSRVVCDLCGKILPNSFAYAEHIQNVHETQEKLQCDICKAWLLNKSTLRIHISRRHVQSSQQCPICGKISPNKNALRNHVKTHSAEAREKFKCSVCGKGCRDNYNLADHMRVHSDIKSYVCKFCDTSYRTSKSLRKHMKRDHPTIKQ